MATSPTTSSRSSPPTAPAIPAESRFVNAMRLSAGQWLVAAILVLIILSGTPRLWKRIERFDSKGDYRIPYALSKDYWLYERRLQQLAPTDIVVLGDSVIWGEYVRPDGTLTHFLNEQGGTSRRWVNAGVNGLFPLAFDGLIRHYGGSIRGRHVLLHCNVLWMTSAKADLSSEKEERFNHADLVPQFSPRIPCYKADLNRRLAAVVERNFPFAQWANHLQVAYFGQKNLLSWTLEDDGNTPFRLVNAYKNPLAQITMTVPTEPGVDLDRGPDSPRHKPWSTTGQGSTRFGWVEQERSLQWAAFQRMLMLLRSRDNNVLVMLGPFNEHIMAEENRADFRRLRDGLRDWLSRNQVSSVIPETLPSELYADGSHPLTEGYRRLATQLSRDEEFKKWSGVR